MKCLIALAVSIAIVVLLSLTTLIAESRADQSQIAIRKNRPVEQSRGIHIIKVIQAVSGSAVRKASVKVELGNSSRRKWEGETDSNGIFSFDCELPNGSVKTYISIDAKGFATFDGIFQLAEERTVQLTKEER